MRFNLIPGRRRQGKEKRGYVRRLLLGRIPRNGPKSDEGDVLDKLELAWMDLLEQVPVRLQAACVHRSLMFGVQVHVGVE